MQKFRSKNINYKYLFLSFVTLIFLVFFLTASPVGFKAQESETGFVPALIKAGNCLLGSAVCESETAQEAYLYTGTGNGGAVAQANALIDDLYTYPSLSTAVWAYDQYQQIYDRDLIAVYAQTPGDNSVYFPGLGYNVLSPILTLWQWSRNMVYIFYVIIIILLAFLILFRQSLGGQTVVTLINSMPSLVLSLILVTLSYPIASFFVDLIYIGTNVVQGAMITSLENAPGQDLITSQVLPLSDRPGDRTDIYYLQPDDPQMSLWAIWETSNSQIIDCDEDADGNLNCANNIIPAGVTSSSGILNYVGSVLPIGEAAADAAVNFLGSASGNSILNLILGIIAFTSALKLFLALLKNYVLLTLSPIYLPWVFLTTALPNRTKSGIWNALKPLLASSLTFIAVYGVFLFMVIIGNSNSFNSTFQGIGYFEFTPPLLGYSQEQVTNVDTSITRSLLIFFLFLSTPTIPEMINNFLNIQPSATLGRAAGEVKERTAKTGTQIFSGISKAWNAGRGG